MAKRKTKSKPNEQLANINIPIKIGSLVGIQLYTGYWKIAEVVNIHDRAKHPYAVRSLRYRHREGAEKRKRIRVIRVDWWNCLKENDVQLIRPVEIAQAKSLGVNFREIIDNLVDEGF